MLTQPASAPDHTSNNRLIILGPAESDAPLVAKTLIEYELSLIGYNVNSLGTSTPIDEFVDAFRDTANAIVMVSLHGHAYEILKGLHKARRDLLIRCPVIVGGNLGVTRERADRTRQRLLSLGVDHVLDYASELLFIPRALPKRNSFVALSEKRMAS
ncbi:hypothetical protein [Bradyrhizobium sp. 33ap4]|uniref:hypothetical protein n=1 Tax=Bradyrhizobium sp. 33ap4 TaxID=3061630 RepID=UPI002930A295|nr:hypothetical protein [Bradyrhizobium sp. 33ap4]